MTETAWFYSSDGENRAGPIAELALRGLFEAGSIQASTLVWREGMPQWSRLDAATTWGAAAIAPRAGTAQPREMDAAWDTAWSDAPHPWRRYVSRACDYLIVGTPFLFAVLVPLFAVLGNSPRLVTILSNPLVWQIILVCLFPFGEAFLLSTWGFTPTRALMGIHIRNADGSKLSYRRALERSWRVALQGMGLGIPLVTLITNVAAYNYLRDSKASNWDETLNIDVRHRRWSVLRAVAVVLWCVIVIFVAVVLQSINK